MDNHSKRLRNYWDELSKLDPDTSIIDPNDRLGFKNRYLAMIRDTSILNGLSGINTNSLALDYGCGTGSASRTLLNSGINVVGLDISHPLLIQASHRCGIDQILFAQTDGVSIPLKNDSIDAIITYGVLIYVTNDNAIDNLLSELYRVMRPGGKLVLIEQARRRTGLADGGIKKFRTIQEWVSLISKSGFLCVQPTIIRQGRFPLTPLIRAGLINERFWRFCAKLETKLGSTFGIMPWDYADVSFTATK